MEREFDISCGVDVGKWSHHFAAIGRRTGEVPLDEKIGQGEGGIRGAPSRILESGRTTIVVGQPGSMSALLFAAADDMGVPRGFITPEAMAQAIETCGGEVKADAHDALVIAEVSAGLPRLAKPVGGKSGACLRLAALMSYDRELTEEATRASNGLHDLLLATCPALEAHLGGRAHPEPAPPGRPGEVRRAFGSQEGRARERGAPGQAQEGHGAGRALEDRRAVRRRLAPRAGQSGKAVHSVTKPRSGNRRLKRVLVLSASKSILFCDESRAYYDRKRAEGRGYNSAVTALARRRLNVMYAMLRDGKPYEKNNG